LPPFLSIGGKCTCIRKILYYNKNVLGLRKGINPLHTLIYLFLLFCLAWNLGAEEKEVYKAGLPHIPGIMYRGADGSLQGFNIRLTQSLADQAGVELEWIDGSWGELFEMLRYGEIDLLPGTMVTSERLEYLDFLDGALYIQWGELYVLPRTDFKTITDLEGKLIALARSDNNGKGFISYMEKFQLQFSPIEYSGFSAAIEAVKRREVYGLVGPAGGLSNTEFSGLKSTGLIFSPTTVSIAFPKGRNIILQEKLDQVLREQKNDQESPYYELLQEYKVGEHSGATTIPRWVEILIWVTVTSIVLSSGVIFLLERRLSSKNNELLEQQEKMFQALKLSRIGYWELDNLNESLYWSPELFALLGTEPIREPFKIEDLRQLFTSHSLGELKEQFQSLIWNWDVFNRIVELETLEGKKVWLDWRGQRVINKKRGIDQFQGICLDITDKKKNEEILREKEKWLQQTQKMNSIGQLAGGIAHDFNNMLTGIMGYAEILITDMKDEPLNSYAREIVSIGERASLLTRQLLSYARKGSGITRPFSLHECLESVFAILERTTITTIVLEKELMASHSTILGDYAQIQSALMNMAINSQDAIQQSGKISFSTRNLSLSRKECEESAFEMTPGEYIEIIISDTGEGIPPENINKVFEPFFTTKPMGSGTGTGLGLASVYGTVVSHRGSISINSALGKGTKVTLLLPILVE